MRRPRDLRFAALRFSRGSHSVVTLNHRTSHPNSTTSSLHHLRISPRLQSFSQPQSLPQDGRQQKRREHQKSRRQRQGKSFVSFPPQEDLIDLKANFDAMIRKPMQQPRNRKFWMRRKRARKRRSGLRAQSPPRRRKCLAPSAPAAQFRSSLHIIGMLRHNSLLTIITIQRRRRKEESRSRS
jgi:hypothetical protein